MFTGRGIDKLKHYSVRQSIRSVSARARLTLLYFLRKIFSLLNKQTYVVGALILLFTLFRLLLPVWSGQLGPDESDMALRVKEFLNGGPLPVINTMGSRGVPSGPYPLYIMAILYGLTQFNFSLTFLLTSSLFVGSAFILTGAVSSEKKKVWVLLFALTSPLHIYFTMMGLGDGVWVIPLSALVLFLNARKDVGSIWLELTIGWLLGVLLGIGLAVFILPLGVVAARLFVYRRLRVAFGLFLGLALGISPYAVGLWANRFNISLRLLNPAEESISPRLTDIPLGVFRFFGQQAETRINGAGTWFFAEDLLSKSTEVILVVLFLASVVYLYFNWKRTIASVGALTFLTCTALYIPFGWITNSLYRNYTGYMVWWIAPIVIPTVVLWLIPRRAGFVSLSLLVIFNLTTIAIEYTPRIVNGTQASYAYGHGPSWWAYEEVAASLCAELSNQKPKQSITTIEMAGEPWNERIRFILANLIKLKHPDCAQRVQLIWSDSTPGHVLRVEPDPDKIHLRVVWVTR